MSETTTAERVAAFLRDDFNPSPDSLMTIQEWDAYSLLSAAFNAFLTLPTLFPGDQAEFALHINAAKNIIMSRPVAREMAVLYPPGVQIDNVAAAGRSAPTTTAVANVPPLSFPPIPPDAEVDQIVSIRPVAGYDSADVWPAGERGDG